MGIYFSHLVIPHKGIESNCFFCDSLSFPSCRIPHKGIERLAFRIRGVREDVLESIPHKGIESM